MLGNDVDDGNDRVRQTVDDVGLNLAMLPVGVGDPAPGQVGQVEDEVGQNDHTGVPHATRGEIGGKPVTLRLIGVVGRQVHPGQAVRGMDVESEGGDEAETEDPEEHTVGKQRDQEFSQELAVDICVVDHLAVVFHNTEIELQVSGHVGQHEPEQHDAGDGHHPLLANGCLVQAQWKRPAFLGRPYRTCRAVCAGHILCGSGCSH